MQLKNRNFILIDTETTGFDEKKNQILEVGILVIKDLKVIDERGQIDDAITNLG